jgi:hypothetical protein
LRATALTWLAMRGDEPLSIRDRAGYANFATTEGYIRRGRNAQGLGVPFPALPTSLLSKKPGNRLTKWLTDSQVPEIIASPRGRSQL